MNILLPFLKLFLPAFGFIVLLIEQKRKFNGDNKYFLNIFLLFFLKELSIIILHHYFNDIYFTKLIVIHYIISFIPFLYLIAVVIKFVSENNKFFYQTIIASILFLSTLILIYLFDLPFNIYIQLTYRIFLVIILFFIIVKLNTLYFVNENINIVLNNKLFLNIILSTFIFQYLLFFATNGIVKHILEINVYLFLLLIAYTKIKEGYKEFDDTINHLKFEREIFLNLLQKVGSGLTSETNFDKILELVLNYSIEVIESKSAALFFFHQTKLI